MRQLRDVAHARAGDKGDNSIIVVIPYNETDLEPLAQILTAARVANHFGARPEDVEIVVAPRLHTITIVVRGILDGGVTKSRGADPHGKTLSGHLLDLPLSTAGE